MMVSESATVSGFILPGNHRSPRYAITYDAVYSGILPSLRSGQVSLDEAEPFLQDPRCQHRYAPMVLGIIPECRSASPESPFADFRSVSPRESLPAAARCCSCSTFTDAILV